MGIVTDPEPTEDEALPRGVSMTWGEACDIEVRRECRAIESIAVLRMGVHTPGSLASRVWCVQRPGATEESRLYLLGNKYFGHGASATRCTDTWQ